MYLYISFFNEESMHSEALLIRGKAMELIKSKFPNYAELGHDYIKGCIGFIKNRGYSNNKCCVLDIEKIEIRDDSIFVDFKLTQELDITNKFINKSLYRLAHKNGWIDKDNGYYPNLCIVNKIEFDSIRKGKPNTRKDSSKTALIQDFRSKNKWEDICNLFEPLEDAKVNKELWDNTTDLYQLAFACSKMGELKNGMERDKEHLNSIKRYRNLSILFYERCNELEPENYLYCSALGYRYYRNYTELTQQKKRYDGKPSDEINNALKWFDRAIELYPDSIKDNYRKGKIILDKQIDSFRYSNQKWTRETYKELEEMENKGINSLEKVINVYEKVTDEGKKKFYLNEYVKSLYCLGKFYLDKANINIDEYLFRTLIGDFSYKKYTKDDVISIPKAKELFEKCWYTETNLSLERSLDYSNLASYTGKWAISPIDKIYKVGCLYLNMYFVKKSNNDINNVEEYRDKTFKYLNTCVNIGRELSKSKFGRRNYWFVNEKLATYYLISGDFEKATIAIQNARDSYIKNTYAIALILSNEKDNLVKAEKALELAVEDKHNLARNKSIALLAYVYNVQGKNNAFKSLIHKERSLVESSSKKYLEYLGLGEL